MQDHKADMVNASYSDSAPYISEKHQPPTQQLFDFVHIRYQRTGIQDGARIFRLAFEYVTLHTLISCLIVNHGAFIYIRWPCCRIMVRQTDKTRWLDRGCRNWISTGPDPIPSEFEIIKGQMWKTPYGPGPMSTTTPGV